MFFSDWPQENTYGFTESDYQVRIERAYMDGTNRMPLVTEKLYWPNGISVDIPTKRIYWVDGKFDLLESVTYDGTYRYWAIPQVRCTPPKEDMGIPIIVPTFFIGNFQNNLAPLHR